MSKLLRNCRNYWSLAGNIWKLKSFRESCSLFHTLPPIFLGTKQSRLLASLDPRGKGSAGSVEAFRKRVRAGPEEKERRKRFRLSSKDPSNFRNMHRDTEWKEILRHEEEDNVLFLRLLLPISKWITRYRWSKRYYAIIEDIHRYPRVIVNFRKSIEFFIARICAATVSQSEEN